MVFRDTDLRHCPWQYIRMTRRWMRTPHTEGMVLDLPTVEESVEAPKIFSSRDRGRKRPSPLPMSLPPMEELNDR